MNRSLKNTAAVLLATALTAMAILTGVSVADVVAGTSGAEATGISTPPSGYYTTASATAQSSGTLTCPRTNCTASTCHATTGMPPGQ